MNRPFLFVILLIILSITSFGQSPILLNGNEEKYFGKQTLVLEDKMRNKKIEDILTIQNEFKPVNQKVFFPNFNSSAYWIKFTLRNLTQESYYLVIDNPVIDSLSIFITDNDKFIELKQSGDLLPFSSREILRSNYIFKLNLPENESRTIFIRYITSADTELPLTLGTAKNVIEKGSWEDLIFGFIYGILCISVLYNLFLYIKIRDRAYLYYIIYLASFILFKSTIEGHYLQFLSPESSQWNNLLSFITFSVMGIFMIAFALEFLKIKSIAPKLYYTGLFFYIGFGVMSLLYFYNKVASISLSSFLLLFMAPYLLVLGIISYKNGYKPALFYLIASAALLLSIVIIGSRSFGIVTYSFFYNNTISFGITLEAILLSFALGDRYVTLKKTNEEAQLKLNKELESQIAERSLTQEELKKLNQDLIQSNTDLDNFIYTASHDLKTPVMNIEGLITILKEQKTDTDENKQILEMMNSSVIKFNSIINDLTDVAKIQRIRAKDNQINILSDVVNIAIQNIHSQLDTSALTIHHDFAQCNKIEFSKSYLIIILENLISNSIKFRSEERAPELFIKSREDKNYNIVEFTDNGIGINSANIEKVFLMFKRAHNHSKGRGIGLYIVKRILENSGGRIELDSKEGIGSTFRLYFKK